MPLVAQNSIKVKATTELVAFTNKKGMSSNLHTAVIR